MIVSKSTRYAGLNLKDQHVCIATLLYNTGRLTAPTDAELRTVDATGTERAADRKFMS